MNKTQALALLGLLEGYSDKDLKTAYRKKAQETHPDKETGSVEHFKLIKESYEYLKNGESFQRGSVMGSTRTRTVRKAIYHGDGLFNYVVR